MAWASHYLRGVLIARFILLLHKNAASSNSPKPVNKTRLMVSSESESPLLSIPQPLSFPPSHALFLQSPLFPCPSSSLISSAHFHTFHPINPRDLGHFSTLSPTHSGLSIYLLVLCLRLRLLGGGAADNSGILPFTFSPHLPPHSQSMAITFALVFLTPR